MADAVIHFRMQGSKQRLESAMKTLERQNVYDPNLNLYKSALNIVRSASLNCYLFEVCPNCVLRLCHICTVEAVSTCSSLLLSAGLS